MAEIETLTTVWDARFDKLEQQLNKVIRTNYAAAAKVEKAWSGANDNLDKTFSRAGGGLSEFAGASRAAGVAAAGATVAVAALFAAFQGARDAAKFAGDLQDTAKRLHVTTDALQEYQYALRIAGGEAEGAETALNAFSETLGKAQAGVKGSLKPFQELRFTEEQVKSFTDADAALKAVVERIQGLPNQQKDAVIQQLGLEKMAPLISDGVDEMERLRAAAHEAGVVMDADLIKRGAELNEKFETVSKVIDLQLKSALVDLGPILVGLLQLVADLARAAADVADNFRSIESKTLRGLQNTRADLAGQIENRLGDRLLNGGKLSKPEQAWLDRVSSRIDAIDREVASRARNVAAPVTPTRTLAEPPGRARGGSRGRTITDKTAQRIEQVNATLAASGQDLLQSMTGLTQDIDDRAAIEKEIAQQEAAEAKARINKQIADIKGDKGIRDEAVRRELIAKLEIAKTNEAEAAQAKERLIDMEAADAKARQALAVRQNSLDLEADILQLAESLARTAGERRDLELKLLDVADRKLTAELEGVLASETASKADKQIAQAKLDQLRATRGGREQQVLNNTMGPWEDFLDKLPQSAAEVDEAFESLYANGVTTLIDGLAEAGAGMRSFKSVIVQTIQQMAVEANRVLLKNLFSGLAGGAGGLFGGFNLGSFLGSGGFNAGGIDISGLAGLYASGGYVSGPGSGRSDSIPAMISNGEFVVNADATRKHRKLLEALNAGNVSRFAGGGYVDGGQVLRAMSRSRSASITNSQTWAPVINVSVSGGGSVAQNRETGAQIGAEASRRMALYRRRGY